MRTFLGNQVMTHLGSGDRIFRQSWTQQGLNRQICLNTGYPTGTQVDRNIANCTGLLEGSRINYRPFLMSITGSPDGVTLEPYVLTNEDLLAEDWQVAESVVIASGATSGVGARG